VPHQCSLFSAGVISLLKNNLIIVEKKTLESRLLESSLQNPV
jgi:hypothetical protein